MSFSNPTTSRALACVLALLVLVCCGFVAITLPHASTSVMVAQARVVASPVGAESAGASTSNATRQGKRAPASTAREDRTVAASPSARTRSITSRRSPRRSASASVSASRRDSSRRSREGVESVTRQRRLRSRCDAATRPARTRRVGDRPTRGNTVAGPAGERVPTPRPTQPAETCRPAP